MMREEHPRKYLSFRDLQHLGLGAEDLNRWLECRKAECKFQKPLLNIAEVTRRSSFCFASEGTQVLTK